MSDHSFLCAVCGGEDYNKILAVPHSPIKHVIPENVQPIERDYASLDIVECAVCGHVFNFAFEPDRFDDLYGGEIQTNSPVDETMSRAIEDARDFVMSGRSDNPTILEIGGGVGAFSRCLSRDAKRVVLIEPSKALKVDDFNKMGIELLSAVFPAEQLVEKFDVVVCRQVLEHVYDPYTFLLAIKERLADDGEAYIEVPCMDYIRSKLSPFDFHYDHVHYFYRTHLDVLMRRAGLIPYRSYDIKNSHDIGFMVRTGQPEVIEVPIYAKERSSFADGLIGRINKARTCLTEIHGKTALYGATVYSQAFTALFPEFKNISVVFDDTDSYAGHCIYGDFGQAKVEKPSVERLEELEAVIIAAHLHDKVIYRKLLSLGFKGNVYSLRPDDLAGTEGYPQSLI